MKAKNKTKYVCQNCASSYAKWSGQCSSCQAWNTIEEETINRHMYQSANYQTQSYQAHIDQLDMQALPALSLSNLEAENLERIKTSIKEFNHVCGGGIVPGAVMLIGGEPGIGKSTLLLQLCNSLSHTISNTASKTNKPNTSIDPNQSITSTQVSDTSYTQALNSASMETNSANTISIQHSSTQHISTQSKPLYISGEEAASQVALRAQRLGIDTNNFLCAFGTNLGQIYSLLEQTKPSLVIIDSIQTMHYDQCDAGAGTVGQIRACSQLLTLWAKTNNIPVILVGHITKEGSLAGPKILEHMVDVVLYFEGERTYPCRMLRAVKNRFGPTDEVGIFEMESMGLKEINNPSQFFLQQATNNNGQNNASGVVIFPSIEGSRPLLIELQALTLHSNMQMPRRAVVGWDQTRLAMIAAVLETKLKMNLSQKEIYINIVAGLKIIEPATDLAAALAIMSAYFDIPLPKTIVAFGEIGLSGEIRQVTRAQARLKEASKLGIKLALTPNNNTCEDLHIVTCSNVQDVLDWLKQYNQKNINRKHAPKDMS